MPRSLWSGAHVVSVGVLQYWNISQSCTNGSDHGFPVGAGKADGRPLGDAGGQRHGLGAAGYQHLGTGHGFLAGATPAADEADQLAGTERLKDSLARIDQFQICGSGAEVFCLPTADYAYLFQSFLLEDEAFQP